jgi:hypothetical protein
MILIPFFKYFENLNFQDYGECTPTAEKNLIFPRFPASSDRPSLPMSQLVRKLSEVEGISPSSHNARVSGVIKTSLDEGVGVDIDDPQLLLDFQQQQQQLHLHAHSERITPKASSFDSASLTSCGSGGMLLTGIDGTERATRYYSSTSLGRAHIVHFWAVN